MLTVLSILQKLMELLPHWALQSLHSGFRPATWAQYTRMFKDFLTFLERAHTSAFKVNTLLVLSYMEHLHQ